MIFPTQVAGIPCQCEVLAYSPPVPMQVTGPGMGDAFAPEPEEIQFRLLDRQGHPAPWLEAKLTDKEVTRLCDEYRKPQ